MRRFAFFVIALIILCSAALSEPAFIGAWATLRSLDDSVEEMTVLRIFPGNVAFYSRQQFTGNSIGEEEKMICTWEQVGDASFTLTSDSGDFIDKYGLINEKRLLSSDYAFVRIDFFARETPSQEPERKPEPTPEPEPTQAPLNSLETGFLLDPGQYIVGEDLPAGGYRFEFYRDSCIITVKEKPTDVLNSDYAYISNKSPVYAKLILREGCLLEIESSPVIIMHAKPLNFGE